MGTFYEGRRKSISMEIRNFIDWKFMYIMNKAQRISVLWDFSLYQWRCLNPRIDFDTILDFNTLCFF